MSHTSPTPDPVALLAAMSPDAVEDRLRDIAAEQDALRVLLRTLRARARHRPSTEPAYIQRLREIAAAETTLPHVREHLDAALAAYDARRAGA